MSHILNDIAFERLDEWLAEHGREPGDVMEDEYGYYILSADDNGNPGEDGYDVRFNKIYLPEIFNPLL